MEQLRTKLLLVLTIIFFAVLMYVTNIGLNRGTRGFGLEKFSRDTEIILLGDVMLGRSVMTKSINEGDYSYPLRRVSERLNNAEIVFANLESPIVTNCPLTDVGLKFCARPNMVEGLVLSNINMVSLANNHSRNYGTEGLNETVGTLNNNKIQQTGLGELETIKLKGITYGFLGFDFTVLEPTQKDYALISESDGLVDILLVGVHWGVEYAAEPRDFQKEWAREMVNSGADVIVGHHPHWVQSAEVINGKLVYYSLGNFVFDQMWSEETKKGLAVSLTFRNGNLIREERLPIYMSSWAQPEFLE